MSGPAARLDGLSIDMLFWLRQMAFGPLHEPEESRVALIAIDEETYRRPPFRDTPKAMWTPELAKVTTAALDAGALVIGQDLILPTSVEAQLPGYDRDYLFALRDGGRAGRLVLGQVQHIAKPLGPFRGHVFAVGGSANIRVVNLFRDADGTIRRTPVSFTRMSTDGVRTAEPSFAVEIAARAMGVEPSIGPDGSVELAGEKLPGAGSRGMLVNFTGGGRGIPVYSFADIVACAEAEDRHYLERAFGDRVVILGTVLDVEDRKRTSARFITGPDGAWFAERCRLPKMDDLYDPAIVRDTVPGSMIFATAVNDILRRQMLAEIGTRTAFALAAATALLAGLVTLTLPLALSFALLGAGAAVWAAAATILFRNGVAVPLLDMSAVALASFGVALIYRITVSDRARRRIMRAFGYYLPAPLINRMIRHDELPELGGETREVTVLVADLAGFTSAAESLPPESTVNAVNRYFEAAGVAIEARGGYVSMFMGDSILAIFGAPADDPNHARHAVEAALDCQEAARRLGNEGVKPSFDMRIGLATGQAVVGNVGSSHRFHYTAMGDTVNVAARLESANKRFATNILTDEATAFAAGDEIVLRPIQRIRLVGREEPVFAYEALGRTGAIGAGELHTRAKFEEASLLRDRGDFAGAGAILRSIRDPVAKILADQMSNWEHHPPLGQSPPIFSLEEK